MLLQLSDVQAVQIMGRVLRHFAGNWKVLVWSEQV